jgi:MoaA/NifB/PqqE/SkfB family radical SAM enzyme
MISVTEFLALIEKDYQVLDCVDLAELTHSPAAAYKFFQKNWRSVYQSNERLIIYTSHAVPDDLLIQLYQAANYIDVSNFFVIIVSQDSLLSNQRICLEFSTDTVPFKIITGEFLSTTKLGTNFTLPNTICPLPWMHLEIDAAQNVKPCCVYNGVIGNVIKTELTELFQAPELQELRQEFLSGKKPKGCTKCWNTESMGITSSRMLHLSLLKTDLINHLHSPVISRLDIKPGSVCNFKCRICNSDSSSSHAEEQHRHKTIPIKIYNWDQESAALTQVSKILDSLINIDMYGGEPFLVKSLTQLAKIAVKERHASKIRLHYNSNGSIWPEKLIPLWSHFRHVDIHFSIDNIGKRFELERGGSWIEVESNITRLLNLKLPNVEISLMPSVNIMNVFYLGDVFEWAEQLGIKVRLNYVSQPALLDIKNLTKSAQQLVIARYQNCRWPELKNIATTLLSSPAGPGTEFQQYIGYYDKIRQENFALTHNEIASAMGYVYTSK